MEVTSVNETLFCGREGGIHEAGFAHLTNSDGTEDKHMFWWLFRARENAENAPVVLVFGGGPGSSGMSSRSSAKAPYPWTDHVNIVAVDHPVGVGFSYGEESSLRSSSREAAWDLDDFLQLFWRHHPHLARNPFFIHSGSYGGTYIPHIVQVIRERKATPCPASRISRINKAPDAVMMSSVWSDAAAHFRYYARSMHDDLHFINRTGLELVTLDMPDCLDGIQLAYEQPIDANKVTALNACIKMKHEELLVGRDMSDNRCTKPSGCYAAALKAVEDVMNSTGPKAATGVPESVDYRRTDFLRRIHTRFVATGDPIQAAYRLLDPAIDDGLRLLVYTGNNDGICSWRSNLALSSAIGACMSLLQTKHQDEFRTAPEQRWPGVGRFKVAGDMNGTKAGDYAFVNLWECGHGPFKDQPKIARHLLMKWNKNESFLGRNATVTII
ncbi:alpha/beta-hydrolase [Punctularia strigosozonata HHB-11173 SS5]|uniref:alpha/beta-hydrolase n=1 Tax=Punctularia strigosozonata (strain HHB-11173) TaxID=741275 RepID=UPI0004416C59|nr:alpha/beta-hydrolase [Punctularia strigosozonata HHB-11173 SS5]EIN10071.1 alpha/beta-hydrolase [Punctularia strigosozonata HHB-11173 SS5]